MILARRVRAGFHYAKASCSAYRGRARGAVSNVGAPELVKEALAMILTTKHPPNERISLLYPMGLDYETAPAACAFVKEHYNPLEERLPASVLAIRVRA